MKLSKLALAATLTLLPLSTMAIETGDWLLRGGITSVNPNDSSSNVFVAGADLGVGVSVDNNAQLGLNLAYFLDSNWAVELLAATPFSHDISLDTVGTLGKTKHLPPTLSALYYFDLGNSNLHPYIGLGVNYTVFFDENFNSANKTAGFSALDLDNSFGLATQLGIDIDIDEKWAFNASVRWLDIDTEATFKLGTDAGKVEVYIDPYVYTLSLAYRF
ncbi:OmpW family outer membrane protein [Planctobacterium marinum]|uniref:OmpW family outer membrane protein n=1 Tax=Planctobacterium marinum TaxID=1631968 RepID=UPI001E601CC7|nr:OmpW family outer membrane protein [Planctobacterium marinum]MCC2608155.1 outer membrane beta-barrel protein [Planctobacterium marinum]